MRVITGSARGARLKAPEGLATRPTSEMVKEAVFSILQNEIGGAAVLDLFAGSGQLGIEALSRGALSCVFVEQDRRAQAVIRENLRHTRLEQGARLVSGDALGFLRAGTERFSLALLDPPYGKGLLKTALPLLAGRMEPGGVILCESDRGEQLPQTAGDFQLLREYRYGRIKLTLYRMPKGEEDNVNSGLPGEL